MGRTIIGQLEALEKAAEHDAEAAFTVTGREYFVGYRAGIRTALALLQREPVPDINATIDAIVRLYSAT